MKTVVEQSRAPATATDLQEMTGRAPDPIPTPALKVALDKTAALLGLILLSPLLAGVAPAMAADGWLHPQNSGSVFYREDRVSQGRVFQLFELRAAKAATIEAETREKDHRHVKPLERDERNKTQVLAFDLRLIGQSLRKATKGEACDTAQLV